MLTQCELYFTRVFCRRIIYIIGVITTIQWALAQSSVQGSVSSHRPVEKAIRLQISLKRTRLSARQRTISITLFSRDCFLQGQTVFQVPCNVEVPGFRLKPDKLLALLLRYQSVSFKGDRYAEASIRKYFKVLASVSVDPWLYHSMCHVTETRLMKCVAGLQIRCSIFQCLSSNSQ